MFNSSEKGIDVNRDQFIILLTDGQVDEGYEACPHFGEILKTLGIKVGIVVMNEEKEIVFLKTLIV